MTAEELENLLSSLDELVRRVVSGQIDMDIFLAEYGYPMGEYALDGHEPEETFLELLHQQQSRIELHREIADAVLARMCSQEDAMNPAYESAGRIGPDEALLGLKRLAAKHELRSAT